MRRGLAGLILSGFLVAAAAAAEEPAAADDDNVLVEGRVMMRSFTERVARYIDGWFGDKPFEKGGNVSGSIGFKVLARQHESLESNLRFRARLDLPNLKDKAYLFFGRQNEDELVSDQPDAFTRRELLLPEDRRKDQTLFAGIGYVLRDLFDFRAGVRGGYKPYGQARYRRDWQLGPRDGVAFRETLFWKSSDGFGSTTTLDYSHAMSPTVALRWQNAATLSEETDGWTWSSSVGAFKYYAKDKRASVEALVLGDTAFHDNISQYGVRAVYERPIYREWTILELSIGHYWPQHRDREDDAREHWAVGLGIDVYF